MCAAVCGAKRGMLRCVLKVEHTPLTKMVHAPAMRSQLGLSKPSTGGVLLAPAARLIGGPSVGMAARRGTGTPHRRATRPTSYPRYTGARMRPHCRNHAHARNMRTTRSRSARGAFWVTHTFTCIVWARGSSTQYRNLALAMRQLWYLCQRPRCRCQALPSLSALGMAIIVWLQSKHLCTPTKDSAAALKFSMDSERKSVRTKFGGHGQERVLVGRPNAVAARLTTDGPAHYV